MNIRKYRKEDRQSVVDICFETRSEDLSEFKDKELFALRWTAVYLEYFPDYCFVAEEDGKVIGYVLSTPDTNKQEELHVGKIIPQIKERVKEDDPYYGMFTGFIPLKNMVGDKLDLYPAHLHINLTSKCRHKGVGTRLMDTMEKNLKDNGITALHLGVMSDNHHAISFYKKNNYKVLLEYGFAGGEVCYFMGKDL